MRHTGIEMRLGGEGGGVRKGMVEYILIIRYKTRICNIPVDEVLPPAPND